MHTIAFKDCSCIVFLSVLGRETGSQTEVGLQTVGQVAQGHCPRVSRRLCPVSDGQEAGSLCPFQSRSERENAKNRLS